MIRIMTTLLCCLMLQGPGALTLQQTRQTKEQFRRLSVPERLRIYNARYDSSGHPRDVELATQFSDRPGQTLNYIIADLPPGDFGRFMRYFPIIYSVSHARGFDICRSAQFSTLESRTRTYRLNAEQLKAIGPLHFKGCALFPDASRSLKTQS